MEPAIIETPYAGEVDRNILYARLVSRWAFHNGFAPFASHLLYTQPLILDDDVPSERELGINAGLEIGDLFNYSIFGLDFGMSKGMEYGRDRAREKGRKMIDLFLFEDELDPDMGYFQFKGYLFEHGKIDGVRGFLSRDLRRTGWK